MKRNDFNKFLEIISNANDKHPIWYCGYLFMDLTTIQHKRLWNTLNDLGYPHETVTNLMGTFDGIKIPSGIVLLNR